MSEFSTIQLKKSVIDSLHDLKDHPRQTYNELIMNLVKHYQKTRYESTYDEFLHKIQQMKMRELWDNEDDEDWDNE